jgi:hypothetical protein
MAVACGRTRVDLFGDAGAGGADVSLDADAAAPDANIGDTWFTNRFTAVGLRIGCFGQNFVKFVPAYQKWVGARLCSSDRYKLFLADTREGAFIELADTAGHGQDHCELINPSFLITSEDDIQSGGCRTCDIGPNGSVEGQPVFARARFGQNFQLASSASAGTRSAEWIECGVSIP